MRLARLYRLAFVLPALFTACGPESGTATLLDAEVDALADAYVDGYFETFPHEATLAGITDRHLDRLPAHTREALDAWERREDAWLETLRAIDPAALESRPAALTYNFLLNQLEAERGFRACRMELWNVSPTWTGWPAVMASLAGLQPVTTANEQQAALTRFGRLPAYLDAEIANLREGLERGYTAPRSNVEAVIEQIEGLLAAPVAESPFVQMAFEADTTFRADLERLETEAIRPAVRRYRDFLRDTYRPAARTEVGVSANPDGDACYRAAVRYYSTLDLSPEDIHRIGLEQMDRIRTEMQEIGAAHFGTTDIDALLETVRTDTAYLFDSREALLAYAEAAVARAEAAMPQAFGRLPDADVIVKPVPSFAEKAAPSGFYTSPAEDGSRPGIYEINLYQADQQSKAGGIEATAFHETYPGHHLQGALALERTAIHPITRYFYLSGFGEGWALYSERLSDELGLYTGPVDRLGLLSNEALRAARLVVDSGMHALGWSREEAIAYLRANTAESDAGVVSQIDRYIAVPGQATSYMLGSLEIRRLREEAESALGDRFDLRAFHDLVLRDGSVPLWVLRERVERWVATQS